MVFCAWLLELSGMFSTFMHFVERIAVIFVSCPIFGQVGVPSRWPSPEVGLLQSEASSIADLLFGTTVCPDLTCMFSAPNQKIALLLRSFLAGNGLSGSRSWALTCLFLLG